MFPLKLWPNSYINAGNFGKASLHPYLTDANGTIVNAGSNSGLGYEAGDPVAIDPITGIVPGSNSISYRYGSNIPGLSTVTQEQLKTIPVMVSLIPAIK